MIPLLIPKFANPRIHQHFCCRRTTLLHNVMNFVRPMSEAPVGTILEIRLPDDFHHHCRDGEQTATVLSHAARRFGRCLMMPNIKPPVTNAQAVDIYKQHILRSLPAKSTMEPLMTLFLTDNTSPEDIRVAAAAGVVGCKYYPAGATTNSDSGVTDIQKCYPTLAAMVEHNMMLCIHSEVTHADIFEREPVFIEEIMKPLVRDFPKLKITMEHISTKEAVDYVLSAPDNVKATITCHHLLYNRNDLLVGGIRPHLYCLPILKAEVHRVALVEAATSGNPKFFLGTDSAPHSVDTKEAACGCAGVYTAHAAVELYTEVFDRAGKLDKLEDFCSSFGADHYGIPRSTNTIQLEKKSWKPPMSYDFGNGKSLRPLRAEEEVLWTITKDALSA